jgi:uncharacterized membrane-anchored protein
MEFIFVFLIIPITVALMGDFMSGLLGDRPIARNATIIFSVTVGAILLYWSVNIKLISNNELLLDSNNTVELSQIFFGIASLSLGCFAVGVFTSSLKVKPFMRRIFLVVGALVVSVFCIVVNLPTGWEI